MFAHSEGEYTWLTKLERIGKLTALNTKTVFNNIGHILSIEMLQDVYQQMNGRKATGIDGTTKEEYGKDLENNLRRLLLCIRKGTYKPRAARIVEIPKEDGSTRPLAISCFEDKLVQSAVNRILCTIFEPSFLPCSYGFRPNHDCHEALRALMQSTYQNHQDGATIEIDIRKYFNTIPHGILMECVRKRISDVRFLRLINILIKTPTVVNGVETISTIGCPQGSIVSPILSNIYLHYAIDVWFSEIGRTHMKGKTTEVRYADDMVFVFHNKKDAERFYTVLPKRLKKFGLELHSDKSRMIESGKKAAARANEEGRRLEVYQFLGFTCYWGKTRTGFWRLKYASRADRFTTKLKGFRKFLWENRNTQDVSRFLKLVVLTVKGWINYHAISDNLKRVWMFVQRCKAVLFKWFNRRGGNKRMNGPRFFHVLEKIGFPQKWKTRLMF